MTINRTTVLVLVVVFTVGWMMAADRQPAPAPQPLVNRPGVRWVVRTARSLLWVMAFAEDNPATVSEAKKPEQDDSVKLVRAPGVEDTRRVDWSEGY